MAQTKNNGWGRRIAGTFFAVVVVGMLLAIMAPATALRSFALIQKQFSERSGGAVTLATASESGAYYALGQDLRDSLAARDSLRLTVVATEGSMANLRALQNGGADVALVQGGLSVLPEDIRGLATLDREYVHILTPMDSPIQSFHDLAGRRVFVGPEASGSADLARTVFDALTFSPPPELVFGESDTAETSLLEGDADAAFLVYRLRAPAMEAMLASGGVRLVSIPEASAIARFTTGCYADYIPHSLYGPNHEYPPIASGSVPTIAVNMILAARADAQLGMVRGILEAIYTQRFRRSAGAPHLDEAYGRGVDEMPLHAEAHRFYTRNDPVSSDTFEIASFFLAVFLLGVSAFQFVSARRRKREAETRRLAIVPYFEAMLTFGNSVENSTDPDQLNSILHSMMASQRRAESEWLAGELDTEHMENLYSVYSTRSRNAFSKIIKLHLIDLKDRQAGIEEALVKLLESRGEESAVASVDKPKAPPKPKPKPVAKKKVSDSGPLPSIVLPPTEPKS